MSRIQIEQQQENENNGMIGGRPKAGTKCCECLGGEGNIGMGNGGGIFDLCNLANAKKQNHSENGRLENINDRAENGERCDKNAEINHPKLEKEEGENGNGKGRRSSVAEKYENYGFGTAAIHASINPQRWDMHQIVPPISLSITYQQPEPNKPVGHEYSREGSPIRDILEDTIAALEQAKYCRVFSSGMSSTVAIANWIPAGGHVIHFDDGYMGTQQLFCKLREKGQIELSFVDLANLDKLKAALKENTKMVFFETPSNPQLKLVDIQAVWQIVKANNPECLIVVDNTLLSPYFQRPLLLGADAVLHSMTKYINGHSDVLVGAIATNHKWLHEHLSEQQKLFGSVLSSFDAWLCVRGIKTLHLRMRQHQENGIRIARWLEADKRVKKVIFPGLESHPQHAVHKKQTSGMSGMISVFLHGDLEATKKFLTSLKIFRLSASLGDIISIADFIPMVMVDGVLPELGKDGKEGDNLIRISVGCEDLKDLIADLDQALGESDIPCCNAKE